jgi:ATP synthase protein I
MGLLVRERKSMIFRIGSRPIRRVLAWQCIAAVVFALAAGLFSGIHGAISAALGGLISVVAGLAFALVMSHSKTGSAGGALLAALRAEAVKIGLVVLLLYLVFATYEDVVAVEFIGSFIITVLIFSAAIMVPEQKTE